MRLAPREETGFSSFEYRYQVLQFRTHLSRTGKGSTLENFLETLITFRKEWLRPQPFLVPSDVCQSTGLCPDVVLKICEYLLLDESINAFTTSILPLLRDWYSKVHLNNPSKRFVEMISQYLDPRQVTSLRIADDPQERRSDLSAFRAFDQLISLTALSERASHRIEQYLYCLPNVRRLSLWLDDEYNSDLLQQLKNLSSYPVTHLHIRCANDCLDYLESANCPLALVKNTTIISFTLDLEYYATGRGAQFRSLNSCHFISSLLRFIKLLVNIRRLRLITTSNHLKSISEVSRWQYILGECAHLNRVIVQLKSHGDFKQEATDMEQELRQFRPEMIFRIITA